MLSKLILFVIFGQILAQTQPKIGDIHTARSQPEAPTGQQSQPQAQVNNEQRNSNTQQQQQTIVLIKKEEQKKPLFQCGFNEMISDCVTPCQPTCEFPNQLPCPEFSARTGQQTPPPPIIIIKDTVGHKKPPPSPCHPGCICKLGYVRDEFARCIPKTKCPALCKPHSHFETCGPRCQPTCEVAEPRGLKECSHDKDVCVSGCFCDAGYVKDLKTGQCVRHKDCSQVCGENEHYSDVGTTCAPTCQLPMPDPYKCRYNSTIVQPGCYCNQGFLRDKDTKKCVKEYLCPKKGCGKGEAWYKCKPCTPSCDNTHPKCTYKCNPGCDCKKGMVRNKKTGKCIPLCECPQFEHIHQQAQQQQTQVIQEEFIVSNPGLSIDAGLSAPGLSVEADLSLGRKS